MTVSPDTVASGTDAVFLLESRDSQGRRLTRGGLTVVFSVRDGTSDGDIGPTQDHGDGTYSASFTGTTAGTPALVDATIDGELVTAARPTITVIPGAASLATSRVTVSRRRLDVGNESILQLRARDDAGNDISSGGLVVRFSASGGTSDGSIGQTSDNGDGTYAATFTATVVGTATTIRATIEGEAVARFDSITVRAGIISAAHSEITVSSDTVTLGAGVLLTLVAKDSAGNPLVGGGHTVEFAYSVGPGVSEGVIEGDTVDLEDGTYISTFRGSVPGTPTTISATIDGDSLTTLLPTITVIEVQASPQNSEVTLDDTLLVAGDSTALRLRVFDSNGDSLTSGGLDIAFTISGGSASSAGAIRETVDHGDGTYSATFVGETAGEPANVGAMIDSTAVEMLDSAGVSMLPTITVVPGAASTDSSLISVADALIELHDSTTLTLQARDTFGNELTGGGLTVLFTATGELGIETGIIGPTGDHGDGTYSATYVSSEEGTAAIGAMIDGSTIADTATISALCATGPVSAVASVVTVHDQSVASGVATTISFRARDAAGNCLRNSGLTVVFSASGGTSTGIINSVPAIDHEDGSYTSTFTALIAGSPTTIGATFDGVPVASQLPTITVTPGDVSADSSFVEVARAQIDSGMVDTLTLRLRDAVGNVIDSRRQHDVVFTVSGGTSGGTLSPATGNADGTYTATFSGRAVGTPVSIGAIIDGNTVKTPPPTIEVVAGTISPDNSVLSVSSDTVAAGESATLTLKGRDDSGRELVGGGRTVLFGHAGGTSSGTIDPSVAADNDDGTYTTTFTGEVAGSATTIVATIDGSPVTAAAPTITVVPGDVSVSESILTVSDSVIAVDESATLTLRARDAFGNNLTTGGLVVVFTASTGEGVSVGTVSATTDNADGSYAATFKGEVAGSPATITATINGVPLSSPLPTIRVQ